MVLALSTQNAWVKYNKITPTVKPLYTTLQYSQDKIVINDESE